MKLELLICNNDTNLSITRKNTKCTANYEGESERDLNCGYWNDVDAKHD